MMGVDKRRRVELVRRMQAGDESALDEFCGHYRPGLYGHIVREMDDRQDAEELVQDTFRKVWDNIDSLKAPEKVLSWMYSIADQLIAGRYRKHKKSSAAGSTTDVYEGEGEAAARQLSIRLKKRPQSWQSDPPLSIRHSRNFPKEISG